MVWPGQDGAPYGTPTPATHAPSPYARGMPAMNPRNMAPHATQGTQTTPTLRGGSYDPATVTLPPQPPGVPGPPNAAPPKKTRPRRPSKEYALAARQRRLQQEYTNYHHKPTKDNMWICMFCEYEDIYGVPPEALIRTYEIKDRALRKKAEEQRRLLEKAKSKNRKGKKGGKGGKNAAAQGPPANPALPYDQPLDNMPLPPEGQADEYYDDEYDDGYDPASPSDAADPRYAAPYGYAPQPGHRADMVHGTHLAHDVPAAPTG